LVIRKNGREDGDRLDGFPRQAHRMLSQKIHNPPTMRRPQQRRKPRIPHFERPSWPLWKVVVLIHTGRVRHDFSGFVCDDIVLEDILKRADFRSRFSRPHYPDKIRPSLHVREHRRPVFREWLPKALIIVLELVCRAIIQDRSDGPAGHVVISPVLPMGWILTMFVIGQQPIAHSPLVSSTYDVCTPAVAELDVLIGLPLHVRCTSRDLQVIEDISVEWRRFIVPSAEHPAVALPVPGIRWANVSLDSYSEPLRIKIRAGKYRPSSVTNAQSSSPFAFPFAAYTGTLCPRRRHQPLIISQPFVRRHPIP